MKYNDYELVSLAQENDEYAINLLHEKYRDIIYNKSKKVYSYLNKNGLELSDVIQEALIGFEEAIKGYNQDDKAIFFTFANICIDRQLKTFLLKQSRNKHKILNDAVAIEYDEDNSLYNVLSDDVTPETELFGKEGASELYNNIKNVLTDFEDNVFELKIRGFSYKEIASVLDIDNKDVYNAIGRIKIKINKILEK